MYITLSDFFDYLDGSSSTYSDNCFQPGNNNQFTGYNTDQFAGYNNDQIVGYNMVVYVTQECVEPYFRNFRNFSINRNYSYFGNRESYGEKHFSIYVTADQLANAKSFAPEEFVSGPDNNYVCGFNRCQETAYLLPIPIDNQGRYYPFYIQSVVTE